jgi:hypothetical protein
MAAPGVWPAFGAAAGPGSRPASEDEGGEEDDDEQRGALPVHGGLLLNEVLVTAPRAGFTLQSVVPASRPTRRGEKFRAMRWR